MARIDRIGQVFDLICDGRTGRDIVRRLRFTPSRLKKILRSRKMQRLVWLQSKVFRKWAESKIV